MKNPMGSIDECRSLIPASELPERYSAITCGSVASMLADESKLEPLDYCTGSANVEKIGLRNLWMAKCGCTGSGDGPSTQEERRKRGSRKGEEEEEEEQKKQKQREVIKSEGAQRENRNHSGHSAPRCRSCMHSERAACVRCGGAADWGEPACVCNDA